MYCNHIVKLPCRILEHSIHLIARQKPHKVPALPCCSTISPATRMVLIKAYGLDHGGKPEWNNDGINGQRAPDWSLRWLMQSPSRHLKAQIVKIFLGLLLEFLRKATYRKNHGTTVDGQNPAQPRMMIIPLIIHRVLTIPDGAGFLPSTVCLGKSSMVAEKHPWKKCYTNSASSGSIPPTSSWQGLA